MKTITIFLWCLVGLVLGTVVALGQNPTPIANLQRATTVYTTNIIPVVTNPGQTNGTKGIELDDFLASLVGFPGWPSVSVTNAIGTVKTNGATLTASATSINFVQGSNTVLRATNTSGAVSIEINAVAGSGSVNTNLQVQSLKVFGHQTNTGDIYVNGGSYPKIEITSLTAPTVLTLDTGGITTSAQNNQPYIQLEPQGVLSAQFGTNSWLPSAGFDLGSASARFGIGYFGQIVSTNLRPLAVGSSKLLRTGSDTNLAEVTIGTGLAFDGTTLSTSGGGGGGGSGTDLHVFTNGTLAAIATNLNLSSGITGSVSGTTLNMGVYQQGLTNLNWAIVASTTNVVGISNYVGAISNYVDTASSNRVRLVGGTGGITVSQSGSGGVQTWTINDDDAGGGASSSGTNFQRGLFTNQVEFVSGNLSDATNATITIGQTNAYRWFPSNNAALIISGSWPATYQEVKLTIGLTNGQTSIVLPYGNINGQTNVALRSSPSTNELVIVSDGVRQWIKSGNTLATGTGNHVMLSNAPVVTSLTLAGVATNSIPYIGGGGVISTASLSGLTLSAGVLTASGSVGAANAVGQVVRALPGLSYGPTSWRNYTFVEDEFLSGGTSSGTVGQLSWSTATTGTGTSLTYTGPNSTYESNLFGAIKLAGGSSANSGYVVSMSQASGKEMFFPKTNWGFAYRVMLSATNTTTETNRIQLGWVQSPGAVAYGANGVFFRYDPASSNWQGVVRYESTDYITNCVSPVLAGVWYSLSMDSDTSGLNFVFSVNGVPEVTNSVGVSYGSSRYPIPFASITHSNGTASADLYLEYFNTWRFINR